MVKRASWEANASFDRFFLCLFVGQTITFAQQ